MESHQQSSAPLYLLDFEVAVTQAFNQDIFLYEGATFLLEKVDIYSFLHNPPKTQEYWIKEDLEKLLERKPSSLTIQMKALTAYPEELAGLERVFAIGDVCRFQITFAENFEEADFSLLEKEDGFCWRWLPKVFLWREESVDKDLNKEAKKGKSEDFGSQQKVRWFPRQDRLNLWGAAPNNHLNFLSQAQASKVGEVAKQALEAEFAEFVHLENLLKRYDSLLEKLKEKDQDLAKEMGKDNEALREAVRLQKAQFDDLKAQALTIEAEGISLTVELLRRGGLIKNASILKEIEELFEKED